MKPSGFFSISDPYRREKAFSYTREISFGEVYKTGDSTKASVYNNWYKNVYQPADTPAVDEDETAAGGEG